jgi:hypothetical protein
MDAVRVAEWAVVALVVVVAVGGPAAGFDPVEERPETVGTGTADLDVRGLAVEELRVESGRFGTGVAYLRLPPASVGVADINASLRVVYRVQVPTLGVDVITTRLLAPGDEGVVTLAPRDRGLDTVPADPVAARMTVRVQSFVTDRTVFERNETVEVAG